MNQEPSESNAPPMTLTGKTVEKILHYIKVNQLHEGDLLPPESRFVEILGVSRVILRESCSYLKGLGLLTSRRGSGFRITQVRITEVMQQVLHHVSPLNQQHYEELYELRRYLEIGTVAQAVEAATDNDRRQIQVTLDRFSQLAQLPEIPMNEYLQAELSFHQAIMAAGQCRMLNIIHAAINTFFAASEELNGRRLYHNRTNLERELQEHRMIATAFFLNWPDVAETCLKKHLFRHDKENFSAPAETKTAPPGKRKKRTRE